MNLSRIIALISALALLFALGGCAATDGSVKTSPGDDSSAVESTSNDIGTNEDWEAEFFDDPFEDPFEEENGSEGPRVTDPFEGFNRGIFAFNDALYFYFLKPVAKGWRFIAPEPIRVGIGNVFDNLAKPLSVLNSILQMELVDAGEEFSGFVLNTLVGLGGWFDLASRSGIPDHHEDFGQTLAVWGFDHGPYLVLPFFGPSSLRDAAGLATEFYFDYERDLGLEVFESIEPQTTTDKIAYNGLKAINFLSLDKDTYENVVKESLDPYLFMRNFYIQRRKVQVEK